MLESPVDDGLAKHDWVFGALGADDAGRLLACAPLLRGQRLTHWLDSLYSRTGYACLCYYANKPVALLLIRQNSEIDFQVCHAAAMSDAVWQAASHGLIQLALNIARRRGGRWMYLFCTADAAGQVSTPHYLEGLQQEPSGYARTSYTLTDVGTLLPTVIKAVQHRYGRFSHLPSHLSRVACSQLSPTQWRMLDQQEGRTYPRIYNLRNLPSYSQQNPSLVLFDEGNPLAWCLFEQKSDTHWHLETAYVKPPWRGRGLWLSLLFGSFRRIPQSCETLSFDVSKENAAVHRLVKTFFADAPKNHYEVEYRIELSPSGKIQHSAVF